MEPARGVVGVLRPSDLGVVEDLPWTELISEAGISMDLISEGAIEPLVSLWSSRISTGATFRLAASAGSSAGGSLPMYTFQLSKPNSR